MAEPTVTQQQIQDLYRSLLGRIADPAGMNYWYSLGEQGKSLPEIASAIQNSPEYQAALSPTQWQPIPAQQIQFAPTAPLPGVVGNQYDPFAAIASMNRAPAAENFFYQPVMNPFFGGAIPFDFTLPMANRVPLDFVMQKYTPSKPQQQRQQQQQQQQLEQIDPDQTQPITTFDPIRNNTPDKTRPDNYYGISQDLVDQYLNPSGGPYYDMYQGEYLGYAPQYGMTQQEVGDWSAQMLGGNYVYEPTGGYVAVDGGVVSLGPQGQLSGTMYGDGMPQAYYAPLGGTPQAVYDSEQGGWVTQFTPSQNFTYQYGGAGE